MRKIIISLLILFTLLLTVATQAASSSNTKPPRLQADGIIVTFDQSNGYAVTVDGVPFSARAQLSITDPDWQRAYYTYSSDADRLAQIEKKINDKGGAPVGVTTVLRSDKGDAAVTTQTIEILPGRRLRISLETQPTTGTPLLLENRIAGIAENWIANRPFSAVFPDGETTSGRVFPWPVSSKPAEAKVASGFSSMKIDSLYGPLTIETTGTADITLMDYRLNPWAGGQRYFWFGVLGMRVPAAGLNYQVTIQFPPPRTQAEAPEIAAAPPVMKDQIVFQIQNPSDTILPTPKTISWLDENLPLGKSLSLHLKVRPQEHTTHRTSEKRTVHWEPPTLMDDAAAVIGYFSQRWNNKYGLTLTTTYSAAEATATVEFSYAWDLPTEQAEEVYSLEIDEDGLHILARTATGLRNALATLEQLFRLGPDGALSARGVHILDYPALPFRGIHFFTGRNAAPLQQKMISEIMAPLKINRLVYQVDYLEWDSLPEPHHPQYSMAKAAAKSVADTATAAGIEVIPLVNTFGHSEWLLDRPTMRQLADDPANPYAYDPSNPEVYRICERIYDEAIALFHPRIIHIGHDEVTNQGFPKKPVNKAIGTTKLLIDDILHYHKYLAKRGVKTMIWGDMFLGPGESPDACLAPSVAEARRRRGLLPKDIIIADWHYRPAAPAEYKSLSIFTEAGFQTIACPWDQPKNITNFAQAAAEQRKQTTATLGLLQTTWAGFSFDRQSLENNFDQYAAYVLAAEAAWTGDAQHSAELDYESEFLRRWNQAEAGASRTGWQVELSGIANVALTTATAQRLGVASGAFAGLRPGQNNLGGYQFRLPERQGRAAAVMTSGPVRLDDIESTEQILLALASATSVPGGTELGQISVTADDGTTAGVPLVYGDNIFGIGDPGQTLQTPVIWRSPNLKTNQGAAVIHLLRVKIPGAKRVQSIEITPNGISDVILFGISGAEL